MSLNFVEVTPPARNNPGRTAEPNPFIDAIARIALKEKDGKPVALAYTLDHDADPKKREQAIEKVKRQLTNAGQANEPKVSVQKDIVPVKVAGKDSPSKSIVTFWTTPFIARPRKEKVVAESTDTPNAE